MRLLDLHLKAFGAFTDRALQFGDRPGVVHLVFGPNEAGKTTTLRALADLLFGFPHRSPHGFLHEGSLSVGATVVSDAGQTLHFYRRKGFKKTLRDANDVPIDDGALKPFLGAVDRAFFERIFGLDHEGLRRGGEEMLQGGGDASLGLFGAGAGVADLRKVLAALDADADALFLARGQKPLVNEALKRYVEARKEVKQLTLSGEDWRTARDALSDLRDKLDAATERSRALRTEREKLQRIQRSLAPLAERAELLASRASLASVPDLPESAPEERDRAEADLKEARRELAAAEQEVARLEAQRAAIAPEGPVLEREAALERLARKRGEIAGKLSERPHREAELATARTAVARLLDQAGLPTEDALERIPKRPEVAAVREAITRHQRHEVEREAIARAALDLAAELRAAEESLAAANASAATSPGDEPPMPEAEADLADAVEDARKLGDIDKLLRQARAETKTAESALSSTLSALPFWRGGEEALEALPIPPEATLRRSERIARDEQEQRDRAARALDDARRELARAEEDLSRFDAQGEVPTEEAARRARRDRDQGFRRIRRTFLDGRETRGEGEGATSAPHTDEAAPIADAYEESVALADTLADRLRAEAARVERHRALEAERARRAERAEEAANALAALDNRVAEHAEAFRALFPTLPFPALPPDEMREWLDQRARVLDRKTAARERRRALTELEASHAEARARLDRALHRAAAKSARGQESARSQDEEPFAALLARARRLVEQREGAQRARESRAEAVAGLRAKLATANKRLAEKDTQREAEGAERRAFARKLGRDENASTAELEATLSLCDEASRTLDKAEELARALERIDTDSEAFAREARAAVEGVAPELGTLAPLEAVDRLARLLQAARADAERRKKLGADIAHHESLADKARAAIARAEAMLSELCRRAGVASLDELRAVERASQERRGLTQKVASLDRQLRSGGGGRSLEELAAEASGADADGIPARLEALEAEDRGLDGERTDLARREGEQRAKFEEMRGEDDAARAAQRAEEEVSVIQEGAAQWVRLTLAAALLRRGIDRYREQNQGPVVSRASELFARLTGGAFAGLKVDFGENDEPVLRAVRAGGREGLGREVGVGGMSDGTRDQLFLSLRLAVVEQYVGRNERLPFVADDLLVHFDDARSGAALGVLGELAERTQVLYFTHHDHIVELSRRALGERLLVHRL